MTRIADLRRAAGFCECGRHPSPGRKTCASCRERKRGPATVPVDVRAVIVDVVARVVDLGCPPPGASVRPRQTLGCGRPGCVAGFRRAESATGGWYWPECDCRTAPREASSVTAQGGASR